MVEVPPELIQMTIQQRVIPFIGAGFSAPLNLPSWEEMLRGLVEELRPGLTFDEISKYCAGDMLQVAEYLYLRCDDKIGPLRHALSKGLSFPIASAISSSPHIELVNMGARQIYTTNYDEIIEQVFDAYGVRARVVALPKHLATPLGREDVQVVKYHGDFRYDETLVLTESSYYSRLDFESPMDIKFRSDLLGRSVIFIGYSFRDINIRAIWFKLMKMMQDVPERDRPKSYIVRFEPNPVLEDLYAAVGIATIVLDPESKATTGDSKTDLLTEFLQTLTHSAGKQSEKIPGTNRRLIASPHRLRKIHKLAQDLRQRRRRATETFGYEFDYYYHGGLDAHPLLISVRAILSMQIHHSHIHYLAETLDELIDEDDGRVLVPGAVALLSLKLLEEQKQLLPKSALSLASALLTMHEPSESAWASDLLTIHEPEGEGWSAILSKYMITRIDLWRGAGVDKQEFLLRIASEAAHGAIRRDDQQILLPYRLAEAVVLFAFATRNFEPKWAQMADERLSKLKDAFPFVAGFVAPREADQEISALVHLFQEDRAEYKAAHPEDDDIPF